MRQLKWAAINGVFYFFLVMGLAGIGGAMAVLNFALWFMLIMVVICVAGGVKIEHTPTIPKWLDVGYDILFVGTAVWFGYTGLGVLYAVVMILQECLVQKPAKTAV